MNKHTHHNCKCDNCECKNCQCENCSNENCQCKCHKKGENES